MKKFWARHRVFLPASTHHIISSKNNKTSFQLINSWQFFAYICHLVLKCSPWRRANARNVSFSISVRWSIYIINSVDKPNFRVSLPHRCSTTVSLGTNPLYSFVIIRVQDSRRWSRTCDSCASLVLSNLPCASIARGTRVNHESIV